MSSTVVVIAFTVVVVLLVLVSAVRVIKQYELGVLFRLRRVRGTRQPGLRMIIPFVDVLRRVSLRLVTMPIQSQGASPVTTSASTCRRWLISGCPTW